MANRQDGGTIIIGVQSVNNTPNPMGLAENDLPTWSYDDVATGFAEYADPSITFDLQEVSCESARYIVLRIHEFEDIPVLCKKDYNNSSEVILRRGACYVRSRHKPETSEIPTQEDMRDLLELATDKGVRKFISRATRTGLLPVGPSTQATQSDEQLYKKELDNFV